MSNKDFKVKNGIQPTVYHEAVGTVVSGSENGNFAGATYSGVSFNAGSQDSSLFGFSFNNNGTKLYLTGNSTDTIYQYTLSTAFDLSTASYDSVSFSISSQDTTPRDLLFNGNGTKMYLMGGNTGTVYQYSLSTAFNLSTASYDSVSFSVASQDTSPLGFAFNNDGTSMYVVGSANNSVYQYSLSTAYDLSTASYASKSFSFASQDTTAYTITFNSNGTKMFMVGSQNDSGYQYSLSTAYDISTATYDSISVDLSAAGNDPYGITFNNDETSMYLTGIGNTIYQYSTVLTTAELDLSTGSVFDYTPTSDVQVTLTNPAASGTSSGATLLLNGGGSAGYDLANGVYSNLFYDGTSQSNQITKGELSSDGLKLYLFAGSTLYQYSLSTANDITTAVYDSVSFSFTSQTGASSFRFKPDGTKLYAVGSTTDSIYQYSLSTAWDISTASYASKSFLVSSQDTIPYDVAFKPDGTVMYMTGVQNDTTFQYTLSTAWDISTASYASKSLSHASQISPSAGDISSDGSYFFAMGDGLVYQYNLTTPYDLSTGSYASISFDATAQEGAMRGLRFSSDGKVMYLIGDVEDRIYQYSTATPATITYDSALQWSGGTAPTSPAIGETDVITFNTTDGGTTYKSALAIDGAK
jgi:sugar lactone lactonase YvrE